MTSKLENFSVHYFLTRSLFLGIGFSLIIGLAKQDSIFAFFVGTLIGLLFIFLINKIQKYKGEKTLNDVLKEMKGLGIFLRIVLFLYAFALLCEGLTFIQLFAASFFLIKTPIWFISLPLVLLLIRISKNGPTTTFRVATCLFPISVLLTLLSLGALCGYASLENISPLFVTSTFDFIKSVFYYTTLSVSPSILMLITNKSNSTTSYLFGSFTLVAKMFLIIAIVGPILASIYRFPEYIILKEIKILNFIEKIENIVALSWIFDVFVYLSMSSLMLKELLPKKGKHLLHAFLVIISFFISFLFIGKYYTNELLIYYIFPILMAIIFLLVIPILFIYLFRNYKKNSSKN